jgi:signal transduction histidine kinase
LLAAGVAHEVNTPLAVISTYAQMLAKQISGDAQKAPLLEKIARQTFRASEIVNSLLNFSRTSATEFVSLDLNKTITETLTLLEHQMSTSGVRTEVSLDETLPRIKGSPGKLQQVFLNLVLNARDAMEQGGTLSIHSTHKDGTVRVSITDTGSGIAPQHLLRIFDPFFTTKGAKKGTGLGLSVSYGIVREHGGEIEVHSEPGKGTSFDLVFPAPGSSWKPAARAASASGAVIAAQPSSQPSPQVSMETPATPGSGSLPAVAQSNPVIH